MLTLCFITDLVMLYSWRTNLLNVILQYSMLSGQTYDCNYVHDNC